MTGAGMFLVILAALLIAALMFAYDAYILTAWSLTFAGWLVRLTYTAPSFAQGGATPTRRRGDSP